MPLRRLFASLAIALAATGAYAQSAPADSSTVLPVWNHATGKVEALLLLEPAREANIGARLRFNESALDATFGLSAGDSLGLNPRPGENGFGRKFTVASFRWLKREEI